MAGANQDIPNPPIAAPKLNPKRERSSAEVHFVTVQSVDNPVGGSAPKHAHRQTRGEGTSAKPCHSRIDQVFRTCSIDYRPSVLHKYFSVFRNLGLRVFIPLNGVSVISALIVPRAHKTVARADKIGQRFSV